MVTLLMIIVLFACVAMLYNDGIWSNAIRLINVITAVLLAMNFFEPLANTLESWQPAYSYFWDFISLWALFIVFSLIFRLLTDKVSQVKVKFLKIVDQIGSGFLSLWIGWVMVSFVMVTLHTAPLAKNCLGGSFKPEQKMVNLLVVDLEPDHQLLGFMQKMSQGPYNRSVSEAQWKAKKTVFDPYGEFLPKYATRRAKLESNAQQNSTLMAR